MFSAITVFPPKSLETTIIYPPEIFVRVVYEDKPILEIDDLSISYYRFLKRLSYLNFPVFGQAIPYSHTIAWRTRTGWARKHPFSAHPCKNMKTEVVEYV